MKTARPASFSAFGLLALLVVVIDQYTKWLVMGHFSLYEVLPVIPGFFNLVYVHNPGAAFGLFAGANSAWRLYFFIAVACGALLFVFLAFQRYRARGRVYLFVFSFIGGGALGNLIDRIRFGSVVDFLDFYVGRYHWPAFNAADSAIVVGVGLFLIAEFLER